MVGERIEAIDLNMTERPAGSKSSGMGSLSRERTASGDATLSRLRLEPRVSRKTTASCSHSNRYSV